MSTPKKFLKWLVDPALKDLFPDKPLRFTQEFDWVMIGTCSTGHGHGYFAHTLTSEGTPNPGFFQEAVEKKAKRVLLISECCGAYSPEFQAQLRKMYPDIEFVIPNVWDYCENMSLWKDKLQVDLIRNRILTRDN